MNVRIICQTCGRSVITATSSAAKEKADAFERMALHVARHAEAGPSILEVSVGDTFEDDDERQRELPGVAS